ncbi:hypothetical protein L596_007190 [Steinernema carpocapsae]|uniref:Uncharacterized protein n=1 Tax=Steinernema carpocapsae TaxID=34508 RepID=A0A4U5P977_STECR|nr:hypothetical protein L596_007190 [Steinernema carpocapsae]
MPTKAKGEVLKEFLVVGRKLPSEKEPKPPMYKMQIFASNHVIAKSRFWYFVSMLRRLKKATGEIISCTEVFEKNPTASRTTACGSATTLAPDTTTCTVSTVTTLSPAPSPRLTAIWEHATVPVLTASRSSRLNPSRPPTASALPSSSSTTLASSSLFPTVSPSARTSLPSPLAAHTPTSSKLKVLVSCYC